MNLDVINDVEVIKKHPPESIRRGLVFGTGLSLLLISIITVNNMWEYSMRMDNTAGINEFLILIFSSWGIAYVTFLWVSFFVIVIKNFPGCAWTAIRLGIKSGEVHICVDSVLNAKQDMEQKYHGISASLKTNGFRLWSVGLVALLVFAYILSINYFDLPIRLIMLGVISSLYYLYDITLHEFSKYSTNLTGCGDYQKVLKGYLCGLRKRS